MDHKHRAYSVIDLKSSVDRSGQRIITGIASTPEPDLIGDVVVPRGARYRLPIRLLWEHDPDAPVGEVTDVQISKRGVEFTARIGNISDEGEVKSRTDKAWHSVKAGLVRGVSIGFKALESDFIDTGRLIKKWLWLELSLVSIPMNMDATITTVKSMSRARAAIGSMQTEHKAVSPRASGSSNTANKRRFDMPTITEQLKGFRSNRKDKAARLEELGADLANNGELEESEQDEFDTLRSEVKSIDATIDRLEYTQSLNLKSAKEVRAVDNDSGIDQRTTVPAEPKRQSAGPGIGFTQYVKCLAKANGIGYVAQNIAEKEYAYDPRIAGLVKAAVSGGVTTPGADYAGSLAEPQTLVSEFIELLRANTILGKFGNNGIPALRRVPFNIKVQRHTGGLTGAWTGEGAASPVSAAIFDAVTLGKTKVTSLTAMSEEMLRFANIAADASMRDALVDSLSTRLDIDLVDPGNAGIANVKPASIVNGVTGVTSAGDDAASIRTDLQQLMNRFASAKIRTSGKVLIMSEELRIALLLLRNSLGQAEFAEIDDYRLAGFNVISSDSVPPATVVAVSPDNILLADDDTVDVRMSDQATLEMDTEPSGSIATPTGATGAMVNMFQVESVAIKASRYINWQKARPEAAQLLTGATWNGSPPAAV